MSSENIKYYCKNYSEELKEDWNYVLHNSDDNWMFNDLDLNKIYASRDQAKDYSFLVYDSSKDKPIAIVPLFIYYFKWKQFYRLNKTYAKSYYHSGPAIIRQLNEKTRRDIIHHMCKIIENICVKNKVDICTLGSGFLSKRSLNKFYGNINPWQEFRGSWENIPQAHYYLDLTLPIETLKSNLEVRTRTVINKFEANTEFNFKKADAICLNDIYHLFLETNKRTGLPFHPKEEFAWFINYERANYYIAYKGTEPACVINIATFENTAMYWSSYTSNNHLNSQIATYMLWHSILETKKQGIAHFDLGIQPFARLDSKEDSIAKFKRSFGGYLQYGYEIRLNRYNKMQRLLKFILERL